MGTQDTVEPIPTVVFLPAYNEADNLPRLLERIRTAMPADHPWRVLVVDDGSRDKTAACCRAASVPVTLIRHDQNRGLGAALSTGFSEICRLYPDTEAGVVVLDADNTQPPERIPALLKKLYEGYDCVVASRFRPGSVVRGVTPLRRLLSGGAAFLFTVVTPVPGIRDYTCGFRGYRLSALKRAFDRYGEAFVDKTGFECMVDVLLKLARLPVRMTEIPFTLSYHWKKGDTKMPVMRTIWRTLQLVAGRRS